MARLAVFTERYTIRSSVELTALTNFRMAAFELGHELDFLFRSELAFLPSYRGVLIRALTDPLNTSYVVARLAELHGIRVLDHAESIRICCDKVNMYARLQAAGVSMPITRFLDVKGLTRAQADALFAELGEPLVLKAPNSSFSAYVDKVSTPDAFVEVGRRYLRRADRLVVQQYLPSQFDWRVITLAGELLAVARYEFAPTKWKAMDRGDKGEWAEVVATPRDEAPAALTRLALDAAAAIGASLYGVDIKEVDGRFYVIEVNDNPTIEAGGEDRANPDIYSAIIRYLAGEPLWGRGA